MEKCFYNINSFVLYVRVLLGSCLPMILLIYTIHADFLLLKHTRGFIGQEDFRNVDSLPSLQAH